MSPVQISTSYCRRSSATVVCAAQVVSGTSVALRSGCFQSSTSGREPVMGHSSRRLAALARLQHCLRAPFGLASSSCETESLSEAENLHWMALQQMVSEACWLTSAFIAFTAATRSRGAEMRWVLASCQAQGVVRSLPSA